jgi:hypothetical protein
MGSPSCDASTLEMRIRAGPTPLAAILHDLFAQRRRECLAHGWGDVPEFVFCSETGGLLDERNVARTWDRLRRKAQRHGVRPLRLHDCRHTFASLALASGKSVRWVASQLGHANPELTLRVYAHALREEETDLSFLDFGGTRRHPRGTRSGHVGAPPTPVGGWDSSAGFSRKTKRDAQAWSILIEPMPVPLHK